MAMSILNIMPNRSSTSSSSVAIMSQPLKIVDYSPKSIIIPNRNSDFAYALKSLGGTFNKHLKDSTGDSRIEGWVFAKTRQFEVQDLVTSTNKNDIKRVDISEKEFEKKYCNQDQNNNKPTVSLKDYMKLVARVEKLELLQASVRPSSPTNSDYDE